MTRHLDPSSMVLLAVTFVLFLVALFVKGLTHDLLLEAGVFLVSMKLIIMALKNNLQTWELQQRLEKIQVILERIESGVDGKVFSPKPAQ